MIRRTLLAVCLCLSAWAAASYAPTASSAEVTPAVNAADWVSHLPCDTDSPDSAWDVVQPSSVSASGLSWTYQPLAIDLPRISVRQAYRIVSRADATRHHTPVRSPHLFATPLLV